MVDPDEARREARDILSGAEYSEPEEGLVERAVDWLFGRLGDAIATLTGGGPGSVIGWLVVAAVGAGAIWLLIRALRVPAVPGRTTEVGLRYGTETHRDPDVWLDEADRLAAAGDHRGAIRCRYQALIARLVVDGTVDDVPGRTAGEYQTIVSHRLPDESETVERITGCFDAAWYGGAEVAADDHDRFAADCRRLEAAGRCAGSTAGVGS